MPTVFNPGANVLTKVMAIIVSMYLLYMVCGCTTVDVIIVAGFEPEFK